ncbi:MAG: DUF2089 domain-containing protein [Chthonomonas sp.]|nr:DUF2089 domain-containing protein [Chthonomonas sp.]
MRNLPGTDPISGKPFVVSELTTTDGEITVRGEFAIPRWSRLDDENSQFLETFLRCRGVITLIEREMGISYPTVVKRIDALLAALDIVPVKESSRRAPNAESATILDLLEQGQIDAAEAKRRISGEETH